MSFAHCHRYTKQRIKSFLLKLFFCLNWLNGIEQKKWWILIEEDVAIIFKNWKGWRLMEFFCRVFGKLFWGILKSVNYKILMSQNEESKNLMVDAPVSMAERIITNNMRKLSCLQILIIFSSFLFLFILISFILFYLRMETRETCSIPYLCNLITLREFIYEGK